ncbi:MAG: patatin-like phospholipase family protein [Flavobacterium sp.]
MSKLFVKRIKAQSGPIKFCLLFLALYIFPFGIYAQDSIPKKPKIGLVLSGGGAKGLAHIGVLKVIEEAGIKIDYIGGTSMGAIIGGLYASGYTATQLDSIFNNTDYDAVIQDFIPRSSKNFYEKANDERYAFALPFDKFKIGIPTALSKGLYNYNMMTRLTANVRHERDFRKLPIPFLCIATDIETGQEVLLNQGFLAQSVLASGAFPSLYSPLVIDGKYLIDGGVVNNYPLDEVKKMGADIIIGVDVQDDLKNRESLKDATRILVQISNLQMIQKMQEKKKRTDVYIRPKVEGFSVISFDKGSKIIDAGEEAAREVLAELDKLSTSFKKKKTVIPLTDRDSLYISAISHTQLENYTRAYIVGKLRFRAGKKISYSDLKQGIENLNATQNFGSINYTLENDDAEGDRVHLNLTENPYKAFLKLGLHYDGLFKSGILVNFTHKKILFKNDIISTDIVLGDNFRYYLDYYVDNGFYWSFGIKSKFTTFNRNVTTDFSQGVLFTSEDVNSINVDFSSFTNQVYVQTIFIQKFLIGGGLEHQHLKLKSETLNTGDPVIENSDYLSAFGYLKYDSFDNKYFPKRGWYFNGDIQSFFYSTDYTNTYNNFSILKAEAGIAQKLFNRTTLNLQTEGGLTIGEQTVPFFNFVFGGYGFYPINNFKPFYGYDFLSFAGNSYVKALFQLDYEIFKKNHLNFSANFANAGDKIFESDEWLTKPSYTGYGFGYGLETIFGPVEIKHSWSPETKDHHTWFSVGFWF